MIRTIKTALALATVATAAFSAGNAAQAAPCVGTQQTFIFCIVVDTGALPGVNPTGSSYNDCVYVGAPPCKPVSVPIPTTTPGNGGDVVHIGCGGKYGTSFCAG